MDDMLKQYKNERQKKESKQSKRKTKTKKLQVKEGKNTIFL